MLYILYNVYALYIELCLMYNVHCTSGYITNIHKHVQCTSYINTYSVRTITLCVFCDLPVLYYIFSVCECVCECVCE